MQSYHKLCCSELGDLEVRSVLDLHCGMARLVSCNMFISHKALCRNKDKFCMGNKDNCATAKYYKVGLDKNFQWTLDVKWHSTSQVDWLV